MIETFRKLLTLDEAEKVIRKHFKPKSLGVEEVSLLEAYNRVLAENVTATLDIPPFNRSTVDGYAVKAEDTFGAEENKPVKLRVSGTVNIGELPRTDVGDGEAAEIVTGAPIPHGADAVVMMEPGSRDRSKGFGFVTMNSAEEANAAAEAMNGKEVEGRTLVCNIARPRNV